ncbi:hypothetical protein PHMEG_00020740 [Phytophthora megakarya]|uniref:Uncharacterized protein n=1 Tax=Phytophthora megakarya TaxID=4795 RepID=A0A225VNM1_9STRA|nr:hypothetical protein PHMEG_00020740 [Phytophthora megakarya]
MTLNDSSLPTGTCLRVTRRRRSLSEGSNLHLLAAIMEEDAAYRHSDDEIDKSCPTETTQCGNSMPTIPAQRSKSERMICTAQGIRFQVKYQKYQTRLDNLVALAANPTSSNCNVLLAKKALRYRNKTVERRRASN